MADDELLLIAARSRVAALRAVLYLEARGYDGLPASRFYMVSRALVRSLVGALGSAGGVEAAGGCTVAHYLKLAAALARGSDPRLAITHGLPGSGIPLWRPAGRPSPMRPFFAASSVGDRRRTAASRPRPGLPLAGGSMTF